MFYLAVGRETDTDYLAAGLVDAHAPQVREEIIHVNRDNHDVGGLANFYRELGATYYEQLPERIVDVQVPQEQEEVLPVNQGHGLPARRP